MRLADYNYFRAGQGPILQVSFVKVVSVARAQVTSKKSDIFKASYISYISIKKLTNCQHLIQRREVNTTSKAKHTKVLRNGKDLKTDIMKNVSDNTKEDDSENPKKKLKDISNRDKETYE